MKTVTANISLQKELADYAAEKARQEHHGDLGSYLAKLISERHKAEIEADVKSLAEATKDALPGPDPVDEIVAVCQKVRRKMLRKYRQGQRSKK